MHGSVESRARLALARQHAQFFMWLTWECWRRVKVYVPLRGVQTDMLRTTFTPTSVEVLHLVPLVSTLKQAMPCRAMSRAVRLLNGCAGVCLPINAFLVPCWRSVECASQTDVVSFNSKPKQASLWMVVHYT